jgi:hypothetical protein
LEITIVSQELSLPAKRIDPTADSPVLSGAEDWADFAERMHYVADYFRCSQKHAPLFQPPFSPAQVPSGRL